MTVKRIPVIDASSIDSRDGTLAKGPYIKNGYVEKSGEVPYVVKRPGLLLYKAGSAGAGGGCLSYVNPLTGAETLMSIVGTAVFSNTFPVDVTTVAAVSRIPASGVYPWEDSTTLVSFGGYIWAILGVTRGASDTGKYTRSTIKYSSDGVNWNTAVDVATGTAGYPSARMAPALNYNQKLWVIGGTVRPTPLASQDVWSSPDGVVWTRVTTNANFPQASSNNVAPIGFCVHNGAMYVITCALQTNWYNYIGGVYSSTDGITWTEKKSGAPWAVSGYTGGSNSFPGMFSVGGNLVIPAGGTVSGNVYDGSYYSTDDGVTWTRVDQTTWGGWVSNEPAVIAAHVFSGTLWVLARMPGATLSSGTWTWFYTGDGITWTNSGTSMTMTGAATIKKFRGDVESGTPLDMQNFLGVFQSKLYSMYPMVTYPTDNVYSVERSSTPTVVQTGTVAAGKYDYAQTYDKTKVMFKTAGRGYYIDTTESSISEITSASYPIYTVRGLVYMNGIFYVMDAAGTIYNSAEDDPATWPSTDFISGEFEPDGGVALAKQGPYIVAFGTYTIELFWDVGNATGSPLAPVENSTQLVGCVNGDSVQELEGAIIFIAQSKTVGQTFGAGKFVARIDGGKVSRVSVPAIDRILEADGCDDVDAVVCSGNGQVFYALTLNTVDLTLVFHVQSARWFVWEQRTVGSPISVSALSQASGVASAIATSHGFADGDMVTVAGATPAGYNGSVNIRRIDADTFTYAVSSALSTPATGTITATGSTGGKWPIAFGCNYGGAQLLLGASDGSLYVLDADTYQDNSVVIDLFVRTPKFDMDNNLRKFCGRLEVIADKSTGSGKFLIRTSDDDYNSTSFYRIFDATLPRTGGERWGSFRRRSHDIRHTANERARIEALEADIS